MLIACFSWLKSERFWRGAIASLFFLGFLGGVFLGSLLIYPPPPGSFGFETDTLAHEKSKHNTPAYDAALSGAFSLSEGSSSKFLPLVIREIQLLGANTRPGHGAADKMLLKLRSTGDVIVVDQGKPFYLKVEENAQGCPKVIGFTKEQIGLQLTTLGIRPGGALIEVGVVSPEDGTPSSEKGEVVIERCLDQLSNKPYFKQLKQTKWWGVDTLIRHYGGVEFNGKKESHKLELVNEDGRTFSFVAAGDYMIWDGKVWKEASSETLLEKKPLAQVTQVTSRKMEITVWDESGFYSEKVKLTPQGVSKRPLNLDCLPTSIRLRSESQISCLLAKRRILLKEGDWVLRTSHGWRILKKTSEIEDFLAHRLQGELFIFDQLDRSQGKVTIQGHYFDAMRTQMQKITVPVVSDKRSPKRKSKKVRK